MAGSSSPGGRFELSDEDVSWTIETLRAGRIERKLIFRHKPTGVEMVGVIPPGTYTKAQLNAATQALRATLMEQLRAAVAVATKQGRRIQTRHGA